MREKRLESKIADIDFLYISFVDQNELCKSFHISKRSMKFVPGNEYAGCESVAMQIFDEHSGFITPFLFQELSHTW